MCFLPLSADGNLQKWHCDNSQSRSMQSAGMPLRACSYACENNNVNSFFFFRALFIFHYIGLKKDEYSLKAATLLIFSFSLHLNYDNRKCQTKTSFTRKNLPSEMFVLKLKHCVCVIFKINFLSRACMCHTNK